MRAMQTSETSPPDLEVQERPCATEIEAIAPYPATGAPMAKADEAGIYSVLDIRALRQLVPSSLHADPPGERR